MMVKTKKIVPDPTAPTGLRDVEDFSSSDSQAIYA
jgi:hypothetical protein